MLDFNTLATQRPEVLALIKVPELAIVRNYPDIDRETQNVNYPHRCDEAGHPVVLNFHFSSFRAGIQSSTCPYCQAEVIVEKHNGGEFVAYDRDMAEELLLEA